MTDISKKPELRFAGFNDDWEQRKVGDIYEVNNERNEGQYPVEKTLSIATMTFNEQGNGADTSSLEKYKVLRIGDLAFEGHTNKEFRYGRFVLNNLENGIMSPRFTTLRPIIEQNYNFWEYYIHSEMVMRSKLVNATKAGTMMNELVPDDLFRQSILMPTISEQEKIGAYFKQLDNLITLHQRKYDKLVNVKKSMLEKMFPKNDSNVPEIRFAGFTEAWEQRKLTDFVEFFSGLTYTPNDVQASGTLVLRSSNVCNGEIVDADNVFVDSAVVNVDNVNDGDIVVVVRNGSRSLIGKHAQIKGFMPDTVIGAFMTGIRSQCPAFTNALLNTPHFDEEVAMNMGATINQITGYMFSKMEFTIPSIEEQRQIGLYFESLDNLITLHQRKLEKLKNLKKACLEKMFV